MTFEMTLTKQAHTQNRINRFASNYATDTALRNDADKKLGAYPQYKNYHDDFVLGRMRRNVDPKTGRILQGDFVLCKTHVAILPGAESFAVVYSARTQVHVQVRISDVEAVEVVQPNDKRNIEKAISEGHMKQRTVSFLDGSSSTALYLDYGSGMVTLNTGERVRLSHWQYMERQSVNQ